MAAEKKAAKKKSVPPKKAEYKFDVASLAKKLDIQPASVRVQLRNKKVKKNKDGYGWNSQTDFDKVVKQLSPKE